MRTNIFIGVGAGLAVGAIVTYITMPSRDRELRVSFAPSVNPGQAGGGVRVVW